MRIKKTKNSNHIRDVLLLLTYQDRLLAKTGACVVVKTTNPDDFFGYTVKTQAQNPGTAQAKTPSNAHQTNTLLRMQQHI